MRLALPRSTKSHHGEHKAVNMSSQRGRKVKPPLHLVSNMTPKIKALVVMAPERRPRLLDALESCGIEVLPVCDCNEAHRVLETHPLVQIVVTDTTLPDGDWRRVLEIVEQGRRKTEIVVCSCLGDPKLLESYFLKQGERAARGVRQFRISFL